MIYTFVCDNCRRTEVFRASIKVGAPETLSCLCGEGMRRDYKADAPHIDTSLCKDHSYVPEKDRVYRHVAPKSAAKEEARFQADIQRKRRMARENSGKSSIKQTMSVPADLYHGKIRQTGDKNYWNDPKNLRKHKDCEI